MRRRTGAAPIVMAACIMLLAAGATQAQTVPRGYAPQPPGANLRVRMPTNDGSGFRAMVTNDDARQVVAITFVALVEDIASDRPIRVLTSPQWTLNIDPQQVVTLVDGWLNQAQLDNLRTTPSERLQMFVTPVRIRYADGSEWTLEIDTTATRALRAIRKPFGIPSGV